MLLYIVVVRYSIMKELTQEVFIGKPDSVNWAGVDYDGLLKFGKAINPRYTWASERWRGFEEIGERIENSGYKPLTSIKKNGCKKCQTLIINDVGDGLCAECWSNS